VNPELSRRQWLAGATVVIGAGLTTNLLSQPADAKDRTKDEPFGYCLNTSTIDGQKLTIVEKVEIAAKAGYQAIEPWIRELDQHVKDGGSLKDLGKRIHDSGLTVPSAIGFAEWIVDDDDRRKKGMEEVRRNMDMVHQIGGKRLAAPPAGAYKLDKSHASLILRASHMGFSTYTTRFSRFDADLTFDPKNPAASKVVTTIDATSFEMDSAPQMCLDIMKGSQMLDTAKFPQILFKSESVRMTGEKSMEIFGTLTLHGVTRPIVLTATYNGGYSGMPNMDPQPRIGFSAHGSFMRSDFGIRYGVPAPGTTMGVGDLIDFSIEAEFNGAPRG